MTGVENLSRGARNWDPLSSPRVEVYDAGATNPEVSTWVVSHSTFKEGSNSGGPLDLRGLRQRRLNQIREKTRTNNLPQPPKQRPTRLKRQA